MTTLTITSVTRDSPGAGQVTIVATYADQAFTLPGERKTVGDIPTTNPDWYRYQQLTESALFIVKTGSSPVAILTPGLAKIGYTMEPTLTHAPAFSVHPADDATAFATSTLTSNETAPNDGDQVVIGNKTYTFKTTLTPTEGEVLIATTAANALQNLKRAIDHTGTPDTDYKCAAAHTQVRGGTLTATTLVVTSLTVGTAANSYATTTTASPRLSWPGATMTGGVAAAAFAVTIGSEVSGTTYAWHESADGETYGSALTDSGIYSGATTATLTITPTDTTKSGYYYRCVATNSIGSTTSSPAQLTVT